MSPVDALPLSTSFTLALPQQRSACAWACSFSLAGTLAASGPRCADCACEFSCGTSALRLSRRRPAAGPAAFISSFAYTRPRFWCKRARASHFVVTAASQRIPAFCVRVVAQRDEAGGSRRAPVPEDKPVRHRAIAEVDEFLRERHSPGRPVLLALSGGPDSLALFHALRLSAAMRRGRLELVCGHVDHGWRDESAAEAAAVARACAAFGVRCRVARLAGPPPERDAERVAREARYGALRAWAREEGAQAVLLAHQADEQAETVLKRLLEGADLARLAGMATVAPFPLGRGPPLWRPLLALPKAELLHLLAEVEASLPGPLREHARPADDPSNADARFLRARLRADLLPLLSRAFGKRAARPLALAARSSAELAAYLEARVAPHAARARPLPRGGLHADLAGLPPLHPLEARALLRSLCARAGGRPSREALGAAAAALCAPPAPGRGGERTLDAGRGRLLRVRPGALAVECPEGAPLAGGGDEDDDDDDGWRGSAAEGAGPLILDEQ